MSDSSSSTSLADPHHDYENAYDIPNHYFCGGRALPEPSWTTTNPRRLFCTCENLDGSVC